MEIGPLGLDLRVRVRVAQFHNKYLQIFLNPLTIDN
jgi:hypothetical protein